MASAYQCSGHGFFSFAYIGIKKGYRIYHFFLNNH